MPFCVGPYRATWGRCISLLPFVAAILACGDKQTASDETAAGRGDVALDRDLARACGEVAAQFRRAGAASVNVHGDTFPSFGKAANRNGCGVRAEGTLGGRVTIPFLTTSLPDSLGANWARDSTWTPGAGGTSGTAYAVKRGEVDCLFRINWRMRVRYDPKAEPPPYSADVVCAKSGAR